MSSKPMASLSLDVDDLWAYLRTHGDESWTRRPSYLPRFLPLAIETFDALSREVTFFIVGFDAERPENGTVLRQLVEHGHDIGNHSYAHECWLQLYSTEELRAEILRAEKAITAATGQRPVGFRGPGFSWSPHLLHVLESLGYRYDASLLPTFIAPLARRYFLSTSTLNAAELERRRALFGSFRDGFHRLRPFEWQLGPGRTLLEIPVTTTPIVRVPFHLSYLLYIASFSEHAMMTYLRGALLLCRAFRVEPSFLMHPLDLLGGDEVAELSFFPGMQMRTAKKIRLATRVLRTLGEHFELVTLGTHAEALLRRGTVGGRPV